MIPMVMKSIMSVQWILVKREYDDNGNRIYLENSDGYWVKQEFDDNGNRIYFENSTGYIIDKRPKGSCNGKVVEIDGKKYQLKEVD
jgi:glucan-binding YG repeat protein